MKLTIDGRKCDKPWTILRSLECENPDVVTIRGIHLEIPLDTRKYKRCVVFSDGNEAARRSDRFPRNDDRPFPAPPDTVTFEERGASISRVCESFLGALGPRAR